MAKFTIFFLEKDWTTAKISFYTNKCKILPHRFNFPYINNNFFFKISYFRVLSQKLDVTAFEYSRKVPTIKDKQLGHCVSKVEELFPGRFIEKAW